MGEMEQAIVRVANSITDIGVEQWDACANPSGCDTRNPFISYDFLYALEASGSAIPETGWLAQHLILEDDKGSIAALCPCYLKNHSQGEYVFDHGWADAFYRAGGEYYPKLQTSVPFTPVTGRRLLVKPGPEQAEQEKLLASATIELTRRIGASSHHLTFLTQSEWEHLGKLGFLQRTDQQYHWKNKGYDSFDQFLSQLNSRKRKMIRKERALANSSGITIDWITGNDICEHHWDTFYRFYIDTGNRKWGRPYLTREFYSLIGETMKDDILLVFCQRDNQVIAGALNFIGSDTLYGRHWGTCEHHPFLHFEACYYQAIEFAIEHGLGSVEAGAQGPHKIARGYEPTLTYSAHYIADPSLRRAVAEYLDHEMDYVNLEMKELAKLVPFRKQD